MAGPSHIKRSFRRLLNAQNEIGNMAGLPTAPAFPNLFSTIRLQGGRPVADARACPSETIETQLSHSDAIGKHAPVSHLLTQENR